MARTVNTPRSSMCLVQWRLLAFPSCKCTHARTHACPHALRCKAVFSQCWIPQLSAIIQVVPCAPVCLCFSWEHGIIPSSLAENVVSKFTRNTPGSHFLYCSYSWCRILEEATSEILKYKLPKLSNLMLFKHDIDLKPHKGLSHGKKLWDQNGRLNQRLFSAETRIISAVWCFSAASLTSCSSSSSSWKEPFSNLPTTGWNQEEMLWLCLLCHYFLSRNVSTSSV